MKKSDIKQTNEKKVIIMDTINDYRKKNEKEFKNILDSEKKITYSFNKDIIKVTLDGTEILKGTFDILGFYNTVLNVWYWGWCTDLKNIHLLSSHSKTQKYNKEIKKKMLDSKYDSDELKHLYFYTSRACIYLPDIDNLQNLLSLAMYIQQGKLILPIPPDHITAKNKKEIVEYITITNIL